jgi:hypothetical protein
MAVFSRPTRRTVGAVNINVLPPDLRAAGTSLADASLLLVVVVGALLLVTVILMRNRVQGEYQILSSQLTRVQEGFALLTSPDGVQLRQALQEARIRAVGLNADYDTIAARRIRWSMVVRALHSHPQVRLEEALQESKSMVMTVSGQAGSDAALMEYSNGLRSSGLFDDVKITSLSGAFLASAPTAAPPGLQPAAQATTAAIPTTVPPPTAAPIPPVAPPVGIPPPAPIIPTALAQISTPPSLTAGLTVGPGTPINAPPGGTASPTSTPTVTGTPPTATPSVAGLGYEYVVVWKQSTYFPEPNGPVDKYPGTITGKLIDAADNLIPGATFRIESYGSPPWMADAPGEGRGRSDGNFTFNTLRRSTYRVYVAADNSQAASDLHIGTDGMPGYYHWNVVFRKTSPGWPYAGTPTATFTPGSPTASPTASVTPTFSQPAPPASTPAAASPNNIQARAWDLTGRYGWLDCICNPPSTPYETDNQDWYKIRDIPAGARLSVSLDQATSLRLYIISSGGFVAAQDISTSSTKSLTYDIPSGAGGTYYVLVQPLPGYYSNQTYYLSPLLTQPTPGPTETPTLTPTPTVAGFEFEPNDTCGDSLARNKLAAEANPIRGAIGYVGDRDFYAISVPAGSTINAQVTQPISLNIYIYNDSCISVAVGSGDLVRNPQTVSATVPSGHAGWWYVMVEAATGASSSNAYVLWVNGINPLPATPTQTPTNTAVPKTSTSTPGVLINRGGVSNLDNTEDILAVKSAAYRDNGAYQTYSVALATVLVPVPTLTPPPLPPGLLQPPGLPLPLSTVAPLPAGLTSPGSSSPRVPGGPPVPASGSVASNRAVLFEMQLTIRPAIKP